MSIQYGYCPDALSAEQILRIAGSEIVRDDGQVVSHYLFIEVDEMRLSFDPSRAVSDRFRCDLELVTGNRITFASRSYRGFNDFEDRSQAYSAFVQRLARTLADGNPACRFVTGKPPLNYWLQTLFVAAALFALVSVIVAFGFAYLGWTGWVKLAIVLFFTPVLVRWLRRNRQRRFDPRAIPADLLPAIREPEPAPVIAGSP
jgi:hypothetical protein